MARARVTPAEEVLAPELALDAGDEGRVAFEVGTVLVEHGGAIVPGGHGKGVAEGRGAIDKDRIERVDAALVPDTEVTHDGIPSG